MTTPVGGIGYITINGSSFDLVTVNHKCSGESREELLGMSGPQGYKPRIVNGFIKATLRDTSGLSTAALNALVDATVQVELVNGKTVMGTGVWRNGDAVEVSDEEGTFEIEFCGRVEEF